MKRILTVSFFCLALSGCSIFRPSLGILTPEQQQKFNTVQTGLAGDYTVVDSHLDFMQIKSVTVLPQKYINGPRFILGNLGGPVFIFYLRNGDTLQLRGDRCMRDTQSTKYTCWPTSALYDDSCTFLDSPEYYIGCNGFLHSQGWRRFFSDVGSTYGIAFSLVNKSGLINNYKKLPRYSPVEVKSDDYFMVFYIGDSGIATYTLKRSTPDKSDVRDTSAPQKAQTAPNTAKAPKTQSTNDNATSALDKARAAAGATVGGSTGTGD